MESCLTFLEGSRTHARYSADELHTLDPVDGAPLLARYDLGRAARTLNPRALAERPGPGMWRWGELLPVRDRRHVVHLGEGSTPLLPAARLGPALGVDGLLIKAEGLNPTGSFKARGMAAAVSRARELGVRSLVAPSAGNAGGALAAYGAAAGLPVTVVVPADTPTVNVVEAQMMGARVILVEGFISDCGRVSRAIADQTGAFDVSTLKEPYRVEGKKTMGLELVEQLAWGVPDVIVYPTGGGTGLVGMWKGFDELEELGLIGHGRPRMVAAQAEGCAPMVRAFHSGAETAIPWEDPSTRAGGLRVPGAVGDRLILAALRESEGTAVAVPEGEIDAIQRLAGRRGAGYVSPESAVAFAALAVLADDGWVAANERVVVFDCGVGLKYPPPALPSPPIVSPDIADDDQALGSLLAGLGVRGRPSGGRSSRRGSAGGPSAGGASAGGDRADGGPPGGARTSERGEERGRSGQDGGATVQDAPLLADARPTGGADERGVAPERGDRGAVPAAPPQAGAAAAAQPLPQTSTTAPATTMVTLMTRRRAERRLAEAEADARAARLATEARRAASSPPTTIAPADADPAPADAAPDPAPAPAPASIPGPAMGEEAEETRADEGSAAVAPRGARGAPTVAAPAPSATPAAPAPGPAAVATAAPAAQVARESAAAVPLAGASASPVAVGSAAAVPLAGASASPVARGSSAAVPLAGAAVATAAPASPVARESAAAVPLAGASASPVVPGEAPGSRSWLPAAPAVPGEAPRGATLPPDPGSPRPPTPVASPALPVRQRPPPAGAPGRIDTSTVRIPLPRGLPSSLDSDPFADATATVPPAAGYRVGPAGGGTAQMPDPGTGTDGDGGNGNGDDGPPRPRRQRLAGAARPSRGPDGIIGDPAEPRAPDYVPTSDRPAPGVATPATAVRGPGSLPRPPFREIVVDPARPTPPARDRRWWIPPAWWRGSTK